MRWALGNRRRHRTFGVLGREYEDEKIDSAKQQRTESLHPHLDWGGVRLAWRCEDAALGPARSNGHPPRD